MELSRAIERLRSAGYFASYRAGMLEVIDRDDTHFIKCLDVNRLSLTVLPSEVQRLLERKQQSDAEDGA
jgi:hypothetical protein